MEIKLRQLRADDLCVSHFDREQNLWHAESADGSFRLSDPDRRNLWVRVLDRLLNRCTGVRGRPRKSKASHQFTLTAEVSSYVDRLSASMGVDRSTVVSYLVLKAHAALRADVAREEAAKRLPLP